jgi:hypothetical protein
MEVTNEMKSAINMATQVKTVMQVYLAVFFCHPKVANKIKSSMEFTTEMNSEMECQVR